LDQSPVDCVFQFPHVARPFIGDKPVDGAGDQHRSLPELKLRGLADIPAPDTKDKVVQTGPKIVEKEGF
jgi:hypothetical protein